MNHYFFNRSTIINVKDSKCSWTCNKQDKSNNRDQSQYTIIPPKLLHLCSFLFHFIVSEHHFISYILILVLFLKHDTRAFLIVYYTLVTTCLITTSHVSSELCLDFIITANTSTCTTHSKLYAPKASSPYCFLIVLTEKFLL